MNGYCNYRGCPIYMWCKRNELGNIQSEYDTELVGLLNGQLVFAQKEGLSDRPNDGPRKYYL